MTAAKLRTSRLCADHEPFIALHHGYGHVHHDDIRLKRVRQIDRLASVGCLATISI